MHFFLFSLSLLFSAYIVPSFFLNFCWLDLLIYLPVLYPAFVLTFVGWQCLLYLYLLTVTLVSCQILMVCNIREEQPCAEIFYQQYSKGYCILMSLENNTLPPIALGKDSNMFLYEIGLTQKILTIESTCLLIRLQLVRP